MYTSYFYHAEKLDMYLEIVTVDDTYVCRIDYVDDPEDKNTDDLSDVAKACFNELDLYFDNKLEESTSQPRMVYHFTERRNHTICKI